MSKILLLILMLFAGTISWAADIEILLPVAPKASLAGSEQRGRAPIMLNYSDMFALPLNAKAMLSLPGRKSYSVIHDRVEDHPSGNRTWIGYLADFGKPYRIIITTGTEGSSGRALTPDGEFLITTVEGQDILTDVIAAGMSVAIPRESDAIAPPAAAAIARATAKQGAVEAASPTPQSTVDVMIVYTQSLINQLGSGLSARLDQLIALSNQAYIDSEVAITLRLVYSAQVGYTDYNDMGSALNDITGSAAGTTVPSSLASVATLRDTLGADLVVLLRAYNKTYQKGTCGLAWIGGYGSLGTLNGYDQYGYSVVSNGNDIAGTGYYCGEYTFTHELGHNMGSVHDHRTVANSSTPSETGVFPYSFGYGVDGNFSTIMAYDSSYSSAPQIGYFSNPLLNCPWLPCGVASSATPGTWANNVLSLNSVRADIANYRVTKVGAVPGAPTIVVATAGIGQAWVYFTQPSDTGGSTITGYMATCSASGRTSQSTTGTSSPLAVTGLTSGVLYSCVVTATNAFGTSPVSDVATVTPSAATITVPGAPTIGAATAGVEKASVTFFAPSSTGGSAITGYTATCSASGRTSQSTIGTSSPLTVTGLTSGVLYSCVVTATNAVGTSQVSGAATVIPSAASITVPGAPTIGTATAGVGQAIVTFFAPSSTGGSAITGYTATCSASGQTSRSGSDSGSPLTVTGLTGGVLYTCSVTASNAVGASSASSAVTVTPALPVTALPSRISAGSYHTCAVTAAGGVMCWGDNRYGQLGNGSTNYSGTPVMVTGLSSGVVSVSAGSFHTCAVTVAGGLKCWGYNGFGELGNGTANQSPTPVMVTGLSSGVSSVSAGAHHTCAVAAGEVKCWGYNSSGQLGNGSGDGSATPVDVTGLSSGVASVSAGTKHTCAVTVAGEVKCWGQNSAGQLGNGSTADSAVPVAITGLSGAVRFVSAGYYHTCAVTVVGGLKCWGDNSFGQLGNGSQTGSTTPVDVTGLSSGVASVSVGGQHTCAVTTAGGVKCWGSDGNGQLGNGSTYTSAAPVDVSGLTSGVAFVSAGSEHTCAMTPAGRLKCWGGNGYGQLGNGSIGHSTTPIGVVGLSGGNASVSAGMVYSCAVTVAGGVKCWGYNAFGQLGNGSTVSSTTPVGVTALSSGVATLSAGETHACVVTIAGGIKCWGTNGYGQLGNGSQTESTTPVDVVGLASGVASVSTRGRHTCALTTAGGVKCWGNNSSGELGNGSTEDSVTPLYVSSLSSGVASVSAGFHHTCALTTTGGVKCWGANFYGQLGNGSSVAGATPGDVLGLSSGVAAVFAGSYHTCVLTTAGGVKCWGWDHLSPGFHLTPVDVTGLTSGVASVSAGWDHSCAVTVAGGLKCWGFNGAGQLGNGSFVDSTTPIAVTGLALASGVASVSANLDHTCAVTVAGGVQCWGSNYYGQLGDGTVSYQTTPNDVLVPTVPGAPTIGMATAGVGQATVTFFAPSSTGGSAITGYTVTCSASGQTSRSSTGPGSPLTVTGLTGGVLYSCAVTASNAVGTSVTSRASTVTPVAPGAPLCTLAASPTTITSGTAVTLTATCSPVPTFYTWTNSEFSNTTSSGSVKPFFTTSYAVQGTNFNGAGTSASVTVTVNDTMAFANPSSNYTLVASGKNFVLTEFATGASQTLTGMKRLKFSDSSVALDIDGVGGTTYRLYQAAFGRAPDPGGLGFQMWASEIHGWSWEQVQQAFIDSPEFVSTYGANTTDVQFITLFYSTVLKREPDAGGMAFYLDGMKAGDPRFTRAKILGYFSESTENKTLVLPTIKNGFKYIPTGGN